jgi:MFS transporter, PAT family, beta-lactamase induction signal transducer AmpG
MSAHRVHPWLFLVLTLPFGVSAGYVTVTLAWQLQHAGVAVAPIAAVVGWMLLPNTWKFLWAPIADTTLDPKRWYLIAGVVNAAGIAAMGMVPASSAGLVPLMVVVAISSFVATFIGFAINNLMAICTPEDEQGRVAGWFMAGNLGGTGLGGGLGLWLVQRVPHPAYASIAVGALCLLCCLALLGLPDAKRTLGRQGVVRGVVDVARGLWDLVRDRRGLLALILSLLPVGAGAASGLWSAVANEWGASADLVALITGLLSGVISAAGCVVGGWICDRMDRKGAYVMFGLLQAACAVGMALGARSPAMFVAWTSLYSFITGLTYAGFGAFVLEVIGQQAAATKYSVYASLSNMPIFYMTTIDGWAHDRWSSAGMLWTEAGLCVAGATLFLALAAALGRARGGVRAEARP